MRNQRRVRGRCCSGEAGASDYACSWTEQGMPASMPNGSNGVHDVASFTARVGASFVDSKSISFVSVAKAITAIEATIKEDWGMGRGDDSFIQLPVLVRLIPKATNNAKLTYILTVQRGCRAHTLTMRSVDQGSKGMLVVWKGNVGDKCSCPRCKVYFGCRESVQRASGESS